MTIRFIHSTVHYRLYFLKCMITYCSGAYLLSSHVLSSSLTRPENLLFKSLSSVVSDPEFELDSSWEFISKNLNYNRRNTLYFSLHILERGKRGTVETNRCKRGAYLRKEKFDKKKEEVQRELERIIKVLSPPATGQDPS